MMKRLLLLLVAGAIPALAGPGDIPLDTGSIAATNAYTAVIGPFSGPIAQVDVSLSNTSSVSVDVQTVATSGTKVAKTVLSSGAIVASRSYQPAARMVTVTGTTFTNDQPATIWLSDDLLRVTVSNKNAAVTNSARVTIIRGME